MGEIRQVLKKKKKILFVFKGYSCRFKSEVFASFASIALRPCPVRNRNDYAVPRCRLYQSSSIPSVINLWNSLDNDTRNTRTFDSFKINIKSKVVLAKIPAQFLVGDRRHNILYTRLRRSCSSLKYDLFRSNIITDSRCVCGFTMKDASHFLLNCRLYIEQRTVLFISLHLYYLETSGGFRGGRAGRAPPPPPPP